MTSTIEGVPYSVLVSVLILACIGCSGANTVEKTVQEQEAVLGTWRYQAQGLSRLREGTFQVQLQENRFVVELRDRWHGWRMGRMNVHGSHLEIHFDQLHISGRLEGNEFTGSVRGASWDVSRSHPDTRSGRFVARRVQGVTDEDGEATLGCPSLLWESSYACSPFPGH